MITCIIPCHNDWPTLPRAVYSAYEQVDEIIVVNDASTDAFSDTDFDNMAWIVNAPLDVPMGVVGARNYGIGHAHDGFILPLDADDELLPGAVNKLVSAYQENHFVYPGWREVYADGSTVEYNPPPLNMIATKNIGYATFLFTKAMWQSVGGYPPHFELGAEHWGFMARLRRKGYDGIAVNEPLYIYHREHEGRRSGVISARMQLIRQMIEAELHGLPARA